MALKASSFEIKLFQSCDSFKQNNCWINFSAPPFPLLPLKKTKSVKDRLQQLLLFLPTSHNVHYQLNPIFDRLEQCGEREGIQSGGFSKINLEKSLILIDTILIDFVIRLT